MIGARQHHQLVVLSSEVAFHVGASHPTAAWREATVGVRLRSRHGGNALARLYRLHANHEQVEDHRDLRDG